jgi:translocation and assembly module TamB
MTAPQEQPAAPPKRSPLRRALALLLWLLLSLLSLVVSVAYHFALPETRSLVRHLIEEAASDELAGDIEVGRVEELGIGRARFSDVVIRDPQGRVVISAPTVTAWPDLWRLWEDGTIRVAGGLVEDAEVVLYVEGEDGLEVSLVQAFQPAHRGGAGGEPLHVVIDGLRVERALVHGDAPRYPGLRVEDTHVYGRIEIEEEVVFSVHEGTGRMTAPYPGETSIDRIVLSFTTDRAVGLDAYAEAHRGESRARTRTRVWWPDETEGAPPEVRITAVAEPMCMHTLADMGLPGLDRLEGCAEGDLLLEGTPAELRLRGRLTSEAGTVEVTGRLPDDGRYTFEGRTAGLALDRLVTDAPETTFFGRASVTLERDEATPTRATFEVDAEPLEVEGYEVPAFSARGRIEDERLVVDAVSAPHLGGGVDGTGEIGFDGAVSVHVDVDAADAGDDPNVARLVPGAHGRARGGIDVVTTAGAEDLDIRWNLTFAPFRYGPLRASRLHTTGRARGPRGALRVTADADADGTTVSGVRFGHAEATIAGGLGPYRVALRSRGGADVREVRADLELTRVAGGFDVVLDDYATDLGFGLMERRSGAGVPRAAVRVRGSRFDIEHVEVARESSRLAVRGRVDPRGTGTDLHVELAGFDIALLRPRLPERFSALAGTASGTLDLSGDLDDPDLALEGAVVDATLDGRRHFRLDVRTSYSDGSLYAHVDGDLGDTGHMRIDGPITVAWDALLDTDRVLDEASLAGLEVDLDRVNIAFLTPFAGESVRALGASGKITVALRLVGTVHDLEVPWGVVIVDNLALPNTSAVRVKLEGSLAEHVLTLDRIWLADTRGELVRGGAVARLPLEHPPDTGAGWISAIAREPWQLRLELIERRADAWPRPLAKHVPHGLLVGGVLDLFGDGSVVTSHLDAHARWDEPATRADCAEDIRPEIRVVADTDTGGVTHGQVSLLIDGAVVGTGTTTTRTPMHDWLVTGERPTTPATLADVELLGVALERLPWTCARASGELGGHVRATLFDPAPDVNAELSITGLRVRSDEDGPPSAAFRAQARVLSEGAGLADVEACLLLGREDGARTPLARCPRASTLRSEPGGSFAEDGELILVGAVPVRFGEGATLPEVAWSEDMFALLDARAAELEPLLVAIPGVAQANAIAEGTVRAEGAWESLALEGGLLVQDGEARVVSMGQYLHDVGGPLRFSGDRILIPEDQPWSAWDGDRLVELFGEVRLVGLLPVAVEATLRPDRFPFRREGAILAEVSGGATVSAEIRADGVEGDVRVGELTIALPQSSVGAVQDLALLPEVLVIGEDAPDLGRERHLRFPYTLHVDASRPFTVMRNDFEVVLTANLDVTYDEPDLFVSGLAEIDHGTFEMFGKRFSVARGSLAFDGGAELDPAVDLVAVYELPGGTGATVSILASGTLTDLAIDFQSTESTDTGEILALLVSGRASRATDPTAAAQAGQQAASFLTGLAAGLLTLSLREQFGNVVPNISIEDGGRGFVAARVGWDVDWLIPDFLREVVLGAYLEGTFGTSSRTSTGGVGGGVGVGVTMELSFPYNFSASGSYLVPSNGGIDLLWDAF